VVRIVNQKTCNHSTI